MRKFSFKEKLVYRIDKLLSKGTGILILVLFAITALVVLIAGIAMLAIDPEYASGTGSSIWSTFMYAIDAGTLAGYSNNVLGIIMLALTTICGIFITSMLIGILNNGFEGKLESLKKGTSKVIELDHTVIIGFNENIYTIISELIIANENKKKATIVVLGAEEKATMELEIYERIADTKTTSIICRTGCASDIHALKRCSVETAKSIIINELEDSEIIKSILATTHILKTSGSSTAHITASINNEQNIDVAKIAGEGKVEVVFFKNAISRIIANTCHQSGLSEVYTELFDFNGDEIYIEKISGITGKSFSEVINLFEISTVLGIKRDLKTMLNPPMDTIIQADDELILLAEDDGISTPTATLPNIDINNLADLTFSGSTKQTENLLVLGYNELLPAILNELDNYVAPKSKVTVAAIEIGKQEKYELSKKHENISVSVDECDIYSNDVLLEYAKKGFHHIIVLSADELDIEVSDAKNLMILLHLKSISENHNIKYSVISQMLSAANGELAKITNVNDFIISTNLTALMISQISENRQLASVLEDILDSDGSELYMKPANLYVKTDVPVNLYTASFAAIKRKEILLGYKQVKKDENGNTSVNIITNKRKSDTVVFSENDLLIVIAEQG